MAFTAESPPAQGQLTSRLFRTSAALAGHPMDQLICTSLSHTRYWYEVGMLKVPAWSYAQPVGSCGDTCTCTYRVSCVVFEYGNTPADHVTDWQPRKLLGMVEAPDRLVLRTQHKSFVFVWCPCMAINVSAQYNGGLLLDICVWCPCMAINVSAQHNGGLLLDIILLTRCYHHRGTRLNAMKRLSLQPMIPPKRFDVFPPDWAMLRRSERVQIFL